MAHFAKLGLNSKVLNIHVVDNENLLDVDGKEQEQIGIDYLTQVHNYPFWVQTSYNNTIRKNYAGICYRYDNERDAFIPPKPFTSWKLNEDTCQWEAPTPYPGDENTKYMWDEEVQDWAILQENS
jgi:hypothetical protein